MTQRLEHDPKVPGLQLYHGAKRSSWYLYFRLHGREYRPKLGNAATMPRPQARQKALQWLARLAAETAGQVFVKLRSR